MGNEKTITRRTPAQAEELAAKISAARLSIAGAALLIVIKTATGFITGSISVWASLLDSVMDIIAASINYWVIRIASQPADEDHNYGHDKAESLGGLFQSLTIAISGCFIIKEALRRLAAQTAIQSEWTGIATMLFSAGISIALVKRLAIVGKRTESPALRSDAVHYAMDVVTTGSALLALLITVLTEWKAADPLISIGISLYILWSAVKVGRDSTDVLMDRYLGIDVRDEVAKVVKSFGVRGVRGFHELRTRRSGSNKFVDLHLEIDKTKSFPEAHQLTVEVLRAIEDEIPRTRVHIHTDPVE